MKPRSLTPLCLIPRSSRRSTACRNVACESANATWWTAADVRRRPRRIGRALLVREDRDQAAVAGIEVEVALGLVVEVRLLEDERHPEHALPEVDRRLPVGTDDRDVVDALALEFSHLSSLDLSASSFSQPSAPRSGLDNLVAAAGGLTGTGLAYWLESAAGGLWCTSVAARRTRTPSPVPRSLRPSSTPTGRTIPAATSPRPTRTATRRPTPARDRRGGEHMIEQRLRRGRLDGVRVKGAPYPPVPPGQEA